MEAFLKAMGLFMLAGLAEIGGGWLVWQWIREGRSLLHGVLGALVLVVYGFVPTLQASPHFGRVYAAYGGMFIVLSLAWGRAFDGFMPDRWDVLGAFVCFLGVVIIFFGPR